RCAGVCSLTRGNLAARHADCARLDDSSGKKGWQKLDGSQRGQVHPGLIWQDTIRAGPSSRERTWPLLFLGCRIAAGPWRCQSRMDGKMGVKSPEKGGKMATFAGTCYVAVYGPTPLFSCWTKRLRRGMGGAGWVVAQDGRDLTVERVGCDTLGFPAVVAGDLWPPRTKGYHDVRTEKPSDPGHAARRAG